MSIRVQTFLVLGFLSGIPLACERTQTTSPIEKTAQQGSILASTWPLASFASVLLPNSGVRCLVPAGEDPAFWQPGDAGLEALMKASWILLNGANFESYATTANLPPSRVTETGKAFRSTWITIKDSTVHSHGTQGPHTHQGFDPHFWMDPLLALEQARSIRDGAIERGLTDGSNEAFAALELRLRALDAKWAELAKAFTNETVLANHGTFTYPAQRHGITLQVLDVDPTSPPNPEAGAAIAEAQSKSTIRWMLFEAEPNPPLARVLKERYGLKVLTLRPAEAPIEGSPDAIAIWEHDLAQALEEIKR